MGSAIKKFIAVMLCLSLCPWAEAAITFKQSNSADNGITTSSTISYTGTTTVGSTLYLIFRFGTAGAPTVSDPTNGTWPACDVSKTNTTDGSSISICHFDNNKAASLLTLTMATGASQTHRMVIYEFTGLATSSSLDKTASAESSGAATIDSGATATTAQANELFIGAGETGNTSITGAGTNIAWTGFVATPGSAKCAAEYFIANATQAADAQLLIASSDNWAGAVATYKAAGAVAATSGFSKRDKLMKLGAF